MQRGLSAIACVHLAGCAQLFGIDNTSSVDAGPGGVTLTLQRVSVGATVIKTPLDLTTETASWLVPDVATGALTRVPATIAAPGTWTADLTDGTPAVQFTLPDLPKRHGHLWQLPDRALRGNFLALEHPGAQPPVGTEQLMVTATLPTAFAAGESLLLQAIGPWMAHGLGAGEAPGAGATTVSTTIPYAAFSSQVGAPPARIASTDALLLLRYVGSHLTGVLQVPAFDQTAATDPVTGDVIEVTDDKMLTATIAPATIANRFVAARPSVTGFGLSWSIHAAPGHAFGNAAGVTLQAGTPAMMDTMITAGYTNPFESLDWGAVLQVGSTESRSYAVSAGVNVGLGAGLYTVAAPGTGLTLDLPAGLPELISLDQKPLTTDGMSVTLDLTRPLDVTYVSDQATNTIYQLELSEVVPGTMSATREIVVEMYATDAKFTLPPDLLAAGHTYVLTAYCINGGFTGVATGDLQTMALPYSYGYLDSAVFTVVAQ